MGVHPHGLYGTSDRNLFSLGDFHHPGGSSLYAAYHFHVVSPQVTAMVCYFLLRTKRTRQATSNVQSHSTLYILLCPRWAFGKGNYQKARGQVVLKWTCSHFPRPLPVGKPRGKTSPSLTTGRSRSFAGRGKHTTATSLREGFPFRELDPPKWLGVFAFVGSLQKKTTRNRGTNCFNTHG